MCKFVWFESAKAKRGRFTFKVYEIKREGLVYLCTWEISYASTRGEKSEVMNCLIDNGLLPKSTRKDSWYYEDWRKTNPHKFEISYIVPDNQ